MVDISICMVTLNCWDVLHTCLDSIQCSEMDLTYEIILVDNGSTDGTCDRLRAIYPEVKLIENETNVGFLLGTNQCIRASEGRYILWLNPDTILRPDSLCKMVRAIEHRPHAGIAGPKVLNSDGSFQPQCKRGLPTPMASLCYLTRLDRLWPQHPVVGQYLLRSLHEDQPHEVDAVSGCCLMARREVVDQIGLLDENLKQWGEDIDWCVRARQAGWEVWYDPASVIIHLKGFGGRHHIPYHAARNMHQTMWLFYCKQFRSRSSLFTTAAVRVGISTSLAITLGTIWIKRNILYRSK